MPERNVIECDECGRDISTLQPPAVIRLIAGVLNAESQDITPYLEQIPEGLRALLAQNLSRESYCVFCAADNLTVNERVTKRLADCLPSDKKLDFGFERFMDDEERAHEAQRARGVSMGALPPKRKR